MEVNVESKKALLAVKDNDIEEVLSKVPVEFFQRAFEGVKEEIQKARMFVTKAETAKVELIVEEQERMEARRKQLEYEDRVKTAYIVLQEAKSILLEGFPMYAELVEDVRTLKEERRAITGSPAKMHEMDKAILAAEVGIRFIEDKYLDVLMQQYGFSTAEQVEKVYQNITSLSKGD